MRKHIAKPEDGKKPWYDGTKLPRSNKHVPVGMDLVQSLFVSPHSRGIENLWTMLESKTKSDAALSCAEIAASIVENNIKLSLMMFLSPQDYTSEHGLDHHRDSIEDALNLTLEDRPAVIELHDSIHREMQTQVESNGQPHTKENFIKFMSDTFLNIFELAEKIKARPVQVALAIHTFLEEQMTMSMAKGLERAIVKSPMKTM